jgi:sphinganine-1-phosphate aldolase
VAALDPTDLDQTALADLLRIAGLAEPEGISLPERLAPVNALLDSASGPIREALLTGFLDQLSRPDRARVQRSSSSAP